MKQILRFGAGGTVYTFSDTATSYEDNFAALVPRTTRLPGMYGGFDELGVDPAPTEIGNVTVRLWLKTRSRAEMSRSIDDLRAMASWGVQRLYMRPEGPAEGERWCSARVNNIAMPERADMRMDQIHRVTVDFQVADPFWYSQGTEAWRWGDGTAWGEAPWGGLATPQAISGTSTDLTITPTGNARTLPRITITPDSGKVMTGITISRMVRGAVTDQIAYSGTLNDTDTLEINCRRASVLLNVSTSAYSNFTYNHPDWIRLQPGSNTLRIEMGNSTDQGTATIRYFDAYV